MIELKNLYKTYYTTSGPVTALSNINLHVPPKQIFGIIGRSGAGKSTLIRCVNWLEQPTSGTVTVDGQKLHELTSLELRKLRQEIGMVFQSFNLLSRSTVYNNVAMPLQLVGVDKTEIRKRVSSLLDLVGLSDKHQAFPNQLSGGQKQRVAIARALTTYPKVLLCDEMTSSLDPETTYSILQLIKQISVEFGLSILLITHEMEVIKLIADRVGVIDKGELVEQSDVFQLFTHPQTLAAKSLVQSTLQTRLPEEIQKRLVHHAFPGANPVWRLICLGENSEKPIINQLLRQFDINLSIIQAQLESWQGKTLGIMLVRVSGDEATIKQAEQFLIQHKIKLEQLGYTHADN